MAFEPSGQNLPLSSDEVKEWFSRVELDRQSRKKQSENWRRLFTSYLPPASGATVYDTNSNFHFRNTELKIAEVWGQLPELILSPLEPMRDLIDPRTGQPMSADEVVAVKKALLTKYLGPDHAHVGDSMRQGLFDIFQTSGIAATKIAYQADTVDTQQTVQGPPQTAPGAVLGLQDFPTQQMQTVPVTIYQRFRWYRFSAEKLGIPSDFHSTNYDEAPYLFMEFLEPLTDRSRKAYNLPADFSGSVDRDEMLVSKDQNVNMPGKRKLLHGIEVWLYAAQFDPQIAHSQHMRRLVLIEGLKDRAAVYVDSPFQKFGPDGALLVDEGMIGNPIHPIALRVASDLAWIPADAAFTDPLIRIENTWMTQDLKMRDANLPRFLHSNRISADLDKLKNADAGQGVGIAHDLMIQGAEKLIAPLPKLEHAQADVQGRQQNERRIDQTLGVTSVQGGGVTDTVRSATEIATAQANISVRLKAEQNTLLIRYLQGVRKFDALLQMFLAEDGYIQVIGRDGAQRLAAFTQAHLSGRYAYDAHPDSQLTVDIATKRKEFLDFVNFMAKSGYVNMPIVARRCALLFGFDPAELVQQPQEPPPPKPPPPSVSIQIGAPGLAENLGLPEVRALLQFYGIQLPPVASPELIALAARERAAAQPQHGGSADKADLVDKHQTKNTELQPGQPPLAGQVPQRIAPQQVQ